jgi:phosphoglucosamine mutase
VAALIPRYRLAGGAVISASHNPAHFNGIKFFSSSGAKLSEKFEREIESKSLSEKEIPSGGRAATPFPHASGDFLKFLMSTWPKNLRLRSFRLVLDCAQGATSFLAERLFKSLGADVQLLSAEPNGKNINHRCGALHVQNLVRHVRRKGGDLGVAFDGDADRAIFVDEMGVVCVGIGVLLAVARHLKAQGRLEKNLVVVTVMANLGLFRALDALGIQTVQTAVGDKYVWQAMEETGAVLGGEPSGHVIFREFLSTGDGLLTALQVLALMGTVGRPLSALTSLAVHYPQVLVNVPVKEKKPLETLTRFNQEVRAVEKSLGRTGRVLIRYSGTEPLLRIMIEGPDQKLIHQYAELLARLASR